MLQISYYDQIFGDIAGSKRYYSWLKDKIKKPQNMIEMACGSGDLLSMLSKQHTIVGFDLDPSIIKKAQLKYPELKESFYVDDFLNPKTIKEYDKLICINDSLNYILNLDDLKSFVDASLEFSNELFLDSHHPHRLLEFEEGYLEEGSNEDFDYSYQITRDGDFLIHIINFLDGNFDSVFQWVFDPKILVKLYEEKGYRVDVFTDFDEKGISPKGEKIMYHVYKEDVQ